MCSPNCKRLGLSALAAFILINVLEFVVHGVLLDPVYHHAWYANLWNPESVMKSRMPCLYMAHAIFSIAFAWIYSRGYEEGKSAVTQGLRYGLAVGFLVPVQDAFAQHFVYPISDKLALAWAGTGLVECVLLGIVVSLIYRPSSDTNH